MYLNVPSSNSLVFEDLANILKKDLYDNIPNELDVLSPHTAVEYVDDVEIYEARILDSSIEIAGSAFAQVYTQIGSDGDLFRGEAITGTHIIPFDFNIVYNFKTSTIANKDYIFDLNEYYKNQ